MPADPLLLKAGLWLGVATGLLLLATVVAFVVGWGTRFRLVGVTSFTGLLAISCLAFAISYSPAPRWPAPCRCPWCSTTAPTW